jgi:hypothetical protein
MSFLVFGEIVHGSGIGNKGLEGLAWDIFQRGVDNHLYVMMDANIYGETVWEMLAKQGGSKKPRITFLITNSPMENTSEELMSPSYFGDDRAGIVSANLRKISNWVGAVLAFDHVDNLILFVTENYDISFKAIKADRHDLYSVLMTHVGLGLDVPSFVVDIE